MSGAWAVRFPVSRFVVLRGAAYCGPEVNVDPQGRPKDPKHELVFIAPLLSSMSKDQDINLGPTEGRGKTILSVSEVKLVSQRTFFPLASDSPPNLPLLCHNHNLTGQHVGVGGGVASGNNADGQLGTCTPVPLPPPMLPPPLL